MSLSHSRVHDSGSHGRRGQRWMCCRCPAALGCQCSAHCLLHRCWCWNLCLRGPDHLTSRWHPQLVCRCGRNGTHITIPDVTVLFTLPAFYYTLKRDQRSPDSKYTFHHTYWFYCIFITHTDLLHFHHTYWFYCIFWKNLISYINLTSIGLLQKTNGFDKIR